MQANEKYEDEDNINPSKNPDKKTLGALFIVITLVTFYILFRAIFLNDSNFFIGTAPIIAYFTIQSNIIAFFWMINMTLYIITNKKKFRFVLNVHLSTAITSYMLITGIVFWVVLVPIFLISSELQLFTLQNIWLHTVTPVFSAIMLNYSVNEIKISKIKPKLLLVSIYPILYIIFAVTYAVNGSYLYPMLNPALVGGWLGVIGSAVATYIFFMVIYFIVTQQIKNNIDN